MDSLTGEAIGKVFAAWPTVSRPWKDEAAVNHEVSDMCILATGACARVMQAELGLPVAVSAVDL